MALVVLELSIYQTGAELRDPPAASIKGTSYTATAALDPVCMDVFLFSFPTLRSKAGISETALRLNHIFFFHLSTCFSIAGVQNPFTAVTIPDKSAFCKLFGLVWFLFCFILFLVLFFKTRLALKFKDPTAPAAQVLKGSSTTAKNEAGL